MVYPTSVVDGNQATYPWQILTFNNVLNVGQTFVMCTARVTNQPDGWATMCDYDQATNSISVSLTNEFINSRTLDANTLIIDILYR